MKLLTPLRIRVTLQQKINFWKAAHRFNSYSMGARLMIAHYFFFRSLNKANQIPASIAVFDVPAYKHCTFPLFLSVDRILTWIRCTIRTKICKNKQKTWAFLLLHTNLIWISMFFPSFFHCFSVPFSIHKYTFYQCSPSHTFFPE